MSDDEQKVHVPNPDAPPPIAPTQAIARPAQHRLPGGKRAPFLPDTHVPPRHGLKPGE